jgi:hypothetical protein
MRPLRPSDPAQIGRYELEGRLGAGGMGTVYLGRSPGGRPAAIKVLKVDDESQPEVRLRFRREAEILRTVRNAYTAALIDCELEHPPFWLATEYIPGPTLSRVIAADGALPPEQCFRLAAALAEALGDIHAHGICHRDLKPQNVIMSSTGPQLIDFGIARDLAETGLTQTGVALGTTGYTSPEQFEDRELTPAADIFGLGATIAHAATGRPPYGGGSVESVTYRLMNEDVDLDGVDERLAALLRACLARDPARRPSSEEIIAWCRDERGAAPGAPGAVAPLGRAPRSRRRGLLVAGAVLAALGLFGGGAFAVLRFNHPASVAAPPAPTPTVAAPLSAAAPAPSATAPAPSPSVPPPSGPPTSRPSAARASARPLSAKPTPPPAPPITTLTSADGRCIQLPDNAGNSARVAAQPCDGSAGQQWRLTSTGAVTNGPWCLDSGGDGGSAVQLWGCNATDAQVWAAQADGTLFNARAGRCLSILAGGAVGTSTCAGTASQRWQRPPA